MRDIFRKAAQRYRAWSSLYYYARCKTLVDPAYPATVQGLKDSRFPLLDLGCGMGLFGACLREAGHRAPVTGVDLDEKKIAVARQVLGREDMEFHVANAMDFPAHSGDVVMLDVLHYFDDDQQQRLLTRIAESVAPGASAYLRTTIREPNLRFTLTRIEELVVHHSGWIAAHGNNFVTKEEVIRPFLAAGLEGGGRPMWGWTPFNGYLFSFRRPA